MKFNATGSGFTEVKRVLTSTSVTRNEIQCHKLTNYKQRRFRAQTSVKEKLSIIEVHTMLLGMTYYQIFSYFIIYSFIGWCVEVVFHAVRFGRVINRGFLNGPVCPVYGFGVILVFGVLNIIAALYSSTGGVAGIPIPILYILGLLLTSFVEFMGGFLLDKFFHARWWDYRNEKFNIGGYVCLKFSLIWGAGIVLIVRIFHPMLIEQNLNRFPEQIGRWILVVMYAAYVTDVIVSALTMMKLNQQLAELEELRQSMRVVSNTLSYVLGEGTFVTEELIGRGEGRAYAHATAADSMNTLETRDEFDAKYDALQASMNEKREALQASMDETREAIQAGMDKRRDAIQAGMNERRDAIQASMDKRREAAAVAGERAEAARKAVVERAAAAGSVLTNRAAMDDAEAANDSVLGQEDKMSVPEFSPADAVKKQVAAATNAITEKVSAVAEAAMKNVADITLRTAEEREERRAEAEARKAQLEKDREEWIAKFNERRHRLLRYLFSSHPDIQHDEYQEAMDELRKILEGK